MKKSKVIALTTAMVMIMLTGCGHEHDFQPVSCDQPLTCTICNKTEGEPIGHDFAEATCTEPATCTRCGATEGEPLGHDVVEATCTEPATCKRCGATKGEPLGHDLSGANYQEAAVCSRCGETEGEPLTPGFEEHGLVINGVLDQEFDYATACYEDDSKTTVGKGKFSNFICFKGDEYFPEKDGYVWLAITCTMDYYDDNAWNYGYMTGTCMEDYYTIELHDDTTEYAEKLPEEFGDLGGRADLAVYSTNKINYYGEEMDAEKVLIYEKENGWVDEMHAHAGETVYFHVPEGYDGVVVGYYPRHTTEDEWEEGEYIYDVADDNAIYFRLDPKLAMMVP